MLSLKPSQLRVNIHWNKLSKPLACTGAGPATEIVPCVSIQNWWLQLLPIELVIQCYQEHFSAKSDL
jgi:hypothetical protein